VSPGRARYAIAPKAEVMPLADCIYELRAQA
jgi:hypothetical protein